MITVFSLLLVVTGKPCLPVMGFMEGFLRTVWGQVLILELAFMLLLLHILPDGES